MHGVIYVCATFLFVLAVCCLLFHYKLVTKLSYMYAWVHASFNERGTFLNGHLPTEPDTIIKH